MITDFVFMFKLAYEASFVIGVIHRFLPANAFDLIRLHLAIQILTLEIHRNCENQLS